MFKILSGKLSATFNLDGGHLHRYMGRGAELKRTLCEQCILHDRLIIPTQDYLTACGLVLLVGERSLITLLDEEKLEFARLRGVFGYVRGTGRDGSLVTFADPEERRPQDSTIEAAVDAGLDVIDDELRDRTKLRELLIRQSVPFNLSELVDKVRKDAYQDLRSTRLWHNEFAWENPDLLALPGLQEMQVRVIGPNSQPFTDPVDALLEIARYNIELYLLGALNCSTAVSGSPLGGLVRAKAARLVQQDVSLENLWRLLYTQGIPDLGELEFGGTSYFDDWLKICSTRNAAEFRRWFHENHDLTSDAFLRAYNDLTRNVPWVQKLPTRILRCAVTTGVGMLTLDNAALASAIGLGTSLIDSFVVDRVLRGRSPTFFIDDLREFQGTPHLYQPLPRESGPEV